MPRPHIVLLMADQLRADVLGCYGGKFGATPRLDELAAGSVVFNRHLTNCPLCVPARITQLTGTWPHVHGAIVNAWDKGEEPYGTSRGLKTWYESLAEGGYRVEHVGVNHLRFDPPLDRRNERIRFHAGRAEYDAMLRDRGRSVDLSACRSPCVDYDDGRAVVHDYTNPNTAAWPGPVEEFYDGWIADRLIEQIERADPSQPQAILGEFWSPHCPLTAPEPYYSMFDPDALALPEGVGRWEAGQSPMQLFNLPGHVAAATTPAGWRKAWAVYLGMVRLLDECIGRVLDALGRRGFLDNCLLMFTSDHGEMLGSHRLFQKMCMYEESIRVPMLIRPPGPAGRRGPRAVLTEHLDLPATVCDYAQVPPPPGAVGQSLRRLIEDPAAPGKAEVFIEFNGNSGRSFQQRAIVTPTAKYIHNHNYPPELYDSVGDPQETVNLIQTGTAEAQAGELRRKLEQWMYQTSDCIPMTPSDP